MGKLIYAYLASLDGYIADDADAFDWAVPDEEVMAHLNEAERGIGTYLYGRRIYELMTAWETAPELAADSPGNADFARMWQAAEKIVFSSTLRDVATRRTRIERGFDAETIESLKAAAETDLAVSGADLASTAWRLGLIDEVHLYIAPILVGGGRRMFPDGIRNPLELVDERRFGNGMVFLRYAVTG